MELRQLESFGAVADELCFRRAADRLLVPTSTVSDRVHDLEADLGTALLERTSRRVELTDAGAALAGAVGAVLDAAAEARRVVEQVVDRRDRTLRLGTPPTTLEHLGPLLDTYRAHLPSGHLELTTLCGPPGAATWLLAAGELDAAVVTGPVRGGSIAAVAWEEPLVAVLPRSRAPSSRSPMDLCDLADLPLRLPSDREGRRIAAHLAQACAAEGFLPVRGPDLPSGPDGLTALAGGSSPAWTALPASKTTTVEGRHLVTVPIDDPAAALPTLLAVRPGRRSAALRALLAACRRTWDRPPSAGPPRCRPQAASASAASWSS